VPLELTLTIYRRLMRAELPTNTDSLARFLIGKVLVRALCKSVVSGRIVETEAYIVGDAAGHAYPGMTPRNRSRKPWPCSSRSRI